MGLEVSLVAAVPNDRFGDEIVDHLEDQGVNTDLIKRVDDVHTPFTGVIEFELGDSVAFNWSNRREVRLDKNDIDSLGKSSWTPQTPHGQCGVSSAWLAEVLHRQYSLSSTFCEGSLIFDDEHAESVLDHCWLELNGSDGDELILDLTCDQAQGFDRPIVLDAKTHLDCQGVRYLPRERLSISDLPDSPVWPRYQKLLRNLNCSRHDS